MSLARRQALDQYQRFVEDARTALAREDSTARLAGVNAAWREHGAPLLQTLRRGDLADFPGEARLLGHLVRALGRASALAVQR